MATIDDDKIKVQGEEQVYEEAPNTDKLHDEHAMRIMPESLRAMDEEELAKLEKSIVRKVDMIILYVYDYTYGAANEG
jgi:hypothetical protein